MYLFKVKDFDTKPSKYHWEPDETNPKGPLADGNEYARHDIKQFERGHRDTLHTAKGCHSYHRVGRGGPAIYQKFVNHLPYAEKFNEEAQKKVKWKGGWNF